MLIFAFIFQSHARFVDDGAIRAKARPANERPTIWTRGFYGPLKARFPSSDYRFLDAETRRKENLRDGALPHDERDALFAKLKLTKQVEKMDQRDRDLLKMSAKSFTMAELIKYYPGFTRTQLKSLKQAMEKMK